MRDSWWAARFPRELVPKNLADRFTHEGRDGIFPVLRLVRLDFSLETFQVVSSLKSKCKVLHRHSLKEQVLALMSFSSSERFYREVFSAVLSF